MQTDRANVFTRDDTFFGICEAIGQDIGISPFILRLALGVTLVWNPLAAFGAYLALGVIVLTARVLVPVIPRALRKAAAKKAATAAPATGNDNAELAAAA